MSRVRRSTAAGGLILAAVLVAVIASAGTVASTPARPSVSLKVTYNNGSGHTSTARLTCGRTTATGRGYLRSRAARACRDARKTAAFLATQPSETGICTQIYGGSQTARVGGKIGSRNIDRLFARRDGCEIADWERAGALLPNVK